jgi:hypothetical protein
MVKWGVVAVVLLAVAAGPAWAQTYTVTVQQTTGGNVTVSPSQATYSLGGTATVTAAVTNSSYTFAGWSVAGGTVSPSTSRATLTVQGNVTLSANFLAATPLNMASGFNTEFWVSPNMAAACITASESPLLLYTEPGVVGYDNVAATHTEPAYAFDMLSQATNGSWFQIVTARYPDGYTPSGGSGVGAFPANGTMTSLNPDHRTYYLASYGGNVLYAGDQIEATNQNALLVGQGLYNSGGPPYGWGDSDTPLWLVQSATMSVTPGNYTDINFVLATGQNNQIDGYGAPYIQIWAVYSTGNSALLYDFSATPSSYNYGPPLSGANTDPDFHAVYTSQWGAIFGTNGAANFGETTYDVEPSPITGHSGPYRTAISLYEFVAPRTLDSTRLLTGITFLNCQSNTGSDTGWGASGASLAVLAATATRLYTNACSGTEINVGGTITLTPSGPYYSLNQVVGLVASPNAGWQFVNWSAIDATLSSSTAATTSLTVLGNFDLTALFSEIPFTVTTSSAPLAGGTVSYTPGGTQYINNMIVLAATANPGWQFVSWTASGATLGSTNVATTTATVTNCVSLTASFAPIPYTVTVNQVTGGTVTVTPSQATYYYGNPATVTATITNSSYTFAGWTVAGGTISPSTSQATLTVRGNVTLAANIGVGGTLTVATGQGTATVTPSLASYNYGTVVTIATSTVNAGYVLDHWNLSGASTLSNSRALTTSLTINGNTTLTAAYVTGSYVNNLNPLASDSSNPGSLARPFRTINRATSVARAGSTIVVLQGVYREAPTLNYSGTDENHRITLRSNYGDRVEINGADAIPDPSGSGSWTRCTSATAGGNSNYANIYYTDISWLPTTLYEDEVQLAWAQTSPGTWWVCTGGTSVSLTDSVNLTQSDANYWNGASLLSWSMAYGIQSWLPITSYNPATCTITSSDGMGVYTGFVPAAGVDRYYIDNSIHVLSGPGQVVVQPRPNVSGSYRVFVWPVDGGRPEGHLFEGTFQGYSDGAIWLYDLGYWTFSGLELCNNQSAPLGSELAWNPVLPIGHFTVQNCVIHHNDGGGFGRSDALVYTTFLNNFITQNGTAHGQSNGLSLQGGATNSVVQGNEISFNARHGIDAVSSSLSLVGNYIHDHDLWGHNDDLQFFSSPSDTTTMTNLLLQDNLLTNTIEGTMVNATVSQALIQGNTYYFCEGSAFNGMPGGATINHNTILATGYAPLAAWIGTTLTNNLVEDNGGYFWYVDGSVIATYVSDYNLFYHTVTSSTDAVVNWGWNIMDLPQYAATTSWDTHSLYGNPRFANMGPIFLPGGCGASNDFSPYHFYLLNGTSIPPNVNVGDYICIDCDGVPRQITAINTASNFITFTPSDAKCSFKYNSACDWGSNTNFAIDLTLQPGSPAIGAASDHTNIGSSINVPAYQAGNFGIYGSRPTCWPYTPANVVQWAVVATHSGGDVAVTTSEGQVEPRSKATKFQITFDSAVNGPTISISGITGVTIVSSTGSNYSNRISSVALDSTGQVLTVTLSSPLPDQQWYTIALNPQITAKAGGPARGVKSVKVGLLAGNVTGSGHVTTADVAAERSYIGVPVTPATAKYDVDGNGVITAADQRLIQSLVGHSLP